MAGIEFLARVERCAGHADGTLWTSATGDVFQGAVENTLRVVVADRLAGAGGALVHSAAVVAGGEAFLFVGPSGAGKSTISRMSVQQGYEVLSDDLNAVIVENGRAEVWPVPFAGDLRVGGSGTSPVPLHAVLRLHKANRDELEPLSPAQATAAMLASCPFVNTDPHRCGALQSTITDIVSSSPVGLLRFMLHGQCWSLLRNM